MAEIHLSAITKRFGAQTVLSDIHLHVNAGEFLTLLGPSGCGKSTLLRIIAGLDRDYAGSVHIAGQPVDRLKPKQRNIAMVFQSYALYPHMTVEQNIALPLAMRRLAAWQRLPLVGPLFPSTRAVRAAIRADVRKVAETLEITASLHRKPGQLSGGQRQRVAVARAMVRRPTAFLMDEPLSNLDARLRVQTRTEIADLHRRLGVTFVYVTHDQAEAMALADRIAVMDSGRLRQVATPSQLYREPADEVVAAFVGEGMVLPVDVRSVDGDGTCHVDLFGHAVRMRCARAQQRRVAARACLRARDLTIVAASSGGVDALIDHAIYQGGHFRLEAHPLAAPDLNLHLTVPEPSTLRPGDAIRLEVADGWIIPNK